MSYLLRRNSPRVPKEVTVWEYKGFDAFAQPQFTSPVYISAIWEDADNLQIQGQGKEEQTTTRFYTESEIAVGSFVVEGRYTSSKPPETAREVRYRRTMNFITDRTDVYTYEI